MPGKVLGLIVNPIAGMGGRVGLKGTDTPEVLEEALRRGAEPSSARRVAECFRELKDEPGDVKILTCGGAMGADALGTARIGFEVIYSSEGNDGTTAVDTVSAAAAMKEKVDIIVFGGGDGTARDIAAVVGMDVPMLGIPAGVKMHSSVFAVNPRSAAATIRMLLKGEVEFGEGEVMDIDEEAYRRGELDVKLYGVARVPVPSASGLMQSSKQVFQPSSHTAVLDEIGDFFKEIMDERKDTMFFLGAGSTVGAVKRWLGMETPTLLGIDAFFMGKQAGADLNEEGILGLMEEEGTEARNYAICVSPIGAQGFVLGRGSQQFSPRVLSRVGVDNVYIVATPDKAGGLAALRVDTGDPGLDREFEGFRRVITGYRIQSMMKLIP